MTDKDFIEMEIEYIQLKLDEIKLTLGKPTYNEDNKKRLYEVKLKLDHIEMLIS